MHLTVYFFSRYTIGKSIPLLSCLLLLPSNSTLVNFFSPSPHGNGTSPATDRSETTDNYTLLFEPCFEKFEKDRSEGRKGGRESRFNCFTDGRKKLPSSSSFSSSSLCPFERRLEHERSSSRQSFGAANIGHSVVFCARRASSLGNPLACLKNNSKRRAASRLLTLGRISDEQIIKSRKRRVSIEGVWGRFIDDERVVSASLRICYLDRVGGDIEEGGIWEKRFLFGENFHIIVENNEYSFFFK